jgi:hypothetical protein
MNIEISKHAEVEMKRREISNELVMNTVKNPQQRQKRNGIVVMQSQYFDSFQKKKMLIRVFTSAESKACKVITAYKTSKIEKYWRQKT